MFLESGNVQSTAGGRNTCPGMEHVFGDLLIRDYLSVRSTNERKAVISIEGDSREHSSGSNVKKSSAT